MSAALRSARLEAIEIGEQIKIRKARRDLLSFIKYVKKDYEVNWHHEFICKKLNDFVFGDLNRLMIFAPPRNGKSEIVSRMLPAFLLGNFPDQTIIGASYSAELANKMCKDVQRIMETEPYQKLFPDVKIPSTSEKKGGYSQTSDYFEIVGRRGFLRSAGVGGSITGFGMSVGLLDDVLKDAQQASSPHVLQAIWDWFTSTLLTRLEKKNKVLITLTRWSTEDLAGKVLDLMKSDPEADQYEVISFPAIKEDDENPHDPREIGEALWPNKYDLKRLAQIKASVGSRVWASLYQQHPVPPGGVIFKMEWLRYYQQMPLDFDEIIMSWDMAFKGLDTSDYVAGIVMGRIGADKYVLDLFRQRVAFPETLQAVRQMRYKWPEAFKCLVEDKANGPAVMDTLRKEFAGFTPVEPYGSKAARAHAISPDVESGNVYLPDPSLAPWVGDFVNELIRFTGADGRKDDQVDAFTMAIFELRKASLLEMPTAGHGGRMYR